MNPDGRLNDEANKTYGIVTYHQCLAAGLTPKQVQVRIRSGRLIPLHRGVYRLASAAESPEQLAFAATTALDKAVASHAFAARLYDLRGTDGLGETAEITVPRSGSARVAGVTVHRADLDSRDRAKLGKLPITTPARALLDLACVAPDRLEPALDDALIRWTQLHQVRLTLRRGGGRGKEGWRVLEQLVNERDSGREPTQSHLEDRFMGMVRRRDLPLPVPQIEVLDPPVDFGYPEAMLLYELDGRRWHGTVAAQRRDRRRDRAARALGFELVRVTYEELVWEEEAVAEELLALYGRRLAA